MICISVTTFSYCGGEKGQRMPNPKVQHGASASPGKLKLLAWLVGITVLIGLSDFGDPIDLALRNAQFRIRARPASGQIVIVGIDDEALTSVGGWPWRRDRFAELTDRLMAAGADRIFFDVPFRSMDSQGDEAFAKAIARQPGDRVPQRGVGSLG
ncbi:MAG: CHASE2 domain-containing protein [Sphingobium sp.]|uniref:CHASE2 domain-containing protein n=1 Tax=Sphingobium sp. TaxID=1912891 RepID=UPI0029BE769F|nr:CHASE2 domain-containing protein [Sphingobium sp.]MDX3909171.1 CHASE2 domain-containing protein [Sphingobium sp.]